MSQIRSILALLLCLSLASQVFAQDETLSYGDTVEIDADGATSLEFTFEASEEDTINIFVNSEDDDDSNITLLDPDGDEIFTDDDGGASLNPAIRRLTLDEAGEYTIVISSYDEHELQGEFEITLEQTEALLLNDGEKSITLDDSANSIDTMTLDTESGQSYLVTIVFSETPDGSLFLNLMETDEFYANTRIVFAGVQGGSFVFEADETGRARLDFEFIAYDEEVDVTVSVEAID